MAEVYLAVTRTDGGVVHHAFQTEFRILGGFVIRQPDDATINEHLARVDQGWRDAGEPSLVSWRRMSAAEHEMFAQNRNHRDALEDVGGVIRYNMPKARELHRALIRHVNGSRFLTIDREWVDASARKDQRAADEIEARRKAMRDVVNDPRIDAAQTIEELLAVVPFEG